MSFPPPLRMSRPCHRDWLPSWRKWLAGGVSISTFGCSLSAAVDTFGALSYSLYGIVDSHDAIFVHDSVAELLGGAGEDEFQCYRDVHRGTQIHLPEPYIDEWMTLAPEELLDRAWCNLTLHAHILGISHLPLHVSIA
eukprot:CAMPEP_0176023014 /NCGR_PEP_ID=MMETSP0120_2-20121206/11218_1 /TAXON_ID=160619 /ORGANISM="Kryptoperidinium foliaceum, Strain CCMP 1326" /LENGTH=137 /DNA_ID=CAMNT_0017356169 /DNA_START=119 /DNA_END=532 /DNA_ORIENTATION=+